MAWGRCCCWLGFAAARSTRLGLGAEVNLCICCVVLAMIGDLQFWCQRPTTGVSKLLLLLLLLLRYRRLHSFLVSKRAELICTRQLPRQFNIHMSIAHSPATGPCAPIQSQSPPALLHAVHNRLRPPLPASPAATSACACCACCACCCCCCPTAGRDTSIFCDDTLMRIRYYGVSAVWVGLGGVGGAESQLYTSIQF